MCRQGHKTKGDFHHDIQAQGLKRIDRDGNGGPCIYRTRYAKLGWLSLSPHHEFIRSDRDQQHHLGLGFLRSDGSGRLVAVHEVEHGAKPLGRHDQQDPAVLQRR